MKNSTRLILCLVTVCLVSEHAWAQTAPKELEAARARFDAAMAVATTPVRDRYVQELEQMKNRAISQKNLGLAVEIDKEIKLVAAAPASSSVKTSADLERYLGDTSWTWGTSEKSAGSILTFRKDGMCSVNKDTPVRWAAVDDSTVKLDNGTVIKFSSNNKSYTATTASGIRVGKKQ
ncbi:MAG: hypothetical protein Q8M07_07860 [Prosthecobacter sp.]|nr:hypothetical protein [Prosthecobacter sp.]